MIKIGYITKTFGLKGKLKAFINTNSNLTSQEVKIEGFDEIFFIETIEHKDNIQIIKFKNIDDINDAEKFVGQSILIEKHQLSDNEFLVSDLIGSAVFDDTTKEELGLLTAVENLSFVPVLKIELFDKSSFLIPLVIPEYITSIDTEKKTVFLKNWQWFL